jgi:glycosyltransferase involved in cell wall biosynthesis
MAQELKLQEFCTFYGQCDRQKVYSIVRQVEFCVSSSIYECSGVSVQEEMLMGKPILVTKSGGANSLTTDYTAIVCERGSVDALADGLIEMSERYKQFDREQIRSYAQYSFEMGNVTRRYLKLYRKVLRENNKKINIKKRILRK